MLLKKIILVQDIIITVKFKLLKIKFCFFFLAVNYFCTRQKRDFLRKLIYMSENCFKKFNSLEQYQNFSIENFSLNNAFKFLVQKR